MIAISMIALAVLAYLGRSLVMLASVGGVTGALWLVRRRPILHQMLSCTIGALIGGVVAEVVHVVHHRLQDGTPDHGGFWTSVVLVSVINAAAMVPAIWAAGRRRRRAVTPAT